MGADAAVAVAEADEVAAPTATFVPEEEEEGREEDSGPPSRGREDGAAHRTAVHRGREGPGRSLLEEVPGALTLL